MCIVILKIKSIFPSRLFLFLFIVRKENILFYIIDNICNAGKVYVNGKRIFKAGTPVSDKSVVEIKAEVPKYVCR